MVFAVWAIRNSANPDGVADALADSAAYGLSRIEEIVRSEGPRLGLEPHVVRDYLTRCVRYELGDREREAIRLYLRLATELGLVEAPRDLPYLSVQPLPV